MQKIAVIGLTFLMACGALLIAPRASFAQEQNTGAAQTENPERRVMRVPARTRRRVRGDRRRGRGIGHAYGRAGRAAGRGAKRFATNIARGRVVRGGKELGKGMGEFGKQTGVGTARVGKKVGRKTAGAVKRAVTP